MKLFSCLLPALVIGGIIVSQQWTLLSITVVLWGIFFVSTRQSA